MKRLHLDINVVLDVLLVREHGYQSSSQILNWCDSGKVRGFISSLSFSVIHYVMVKHLGKVKTLDALKDLANMLDISALDGKILRRALDSDFADFEDALQYYSALSCRADAIVTRNKKDFRSANLAILTPEEALTLIQPEGSGKFV